jgi:hypothetical protein
MCMYIVHVMTSQFKAVSYHASGFQMTAACRGGRWAGNERARARARVAEGGDSDDHDVDLRHVYVYTFTPHTWYVYYSAYHDACHSLSGVAFRDSEGDSDERLGLGAICTDKAGTVSDIMMQNMDGEVTVLRILIRPGALHIILHIPQIGLHWHIY